MPDDQPEIADRDELLQILTERARDGHVTAAKTLLEELRRDDDHDDSGSGFEVLDELTPRRNRKAA